MTGVQTCALPICGDAVIFGRAVYVQQFYGVDAGDASLYDLVIDSTVIGLDACVELIALAAADRAT